MQHRTREGGERLGPTLTACDLLEQAVPTLLRIQMDEKRFLETWEIHNRINLYLLDAVEPAALVGLSTSKGRTVGEQFAHIHNVRLMWLKSAAPDLLAGLTKLEKDQAADKKLLRKFLAESGEAIKSLLNRSLEAGGKVKGFKPHASAFLGYLISHESHHRGQIILSLKQAGKGLDKKVLYGIWEWGVR
ncbi:MAG: DinB family protein [Acidobacteriota bacterium]